MGDDCYLDDSGCLAGAFPLAWSSACVSFSVQRDGSKKHGIDAAAFQSVVATAFDTWMASDCGDAGAISIGLTQIGPVACDEVEYNKDQGNANIFMFRDETWEHSPQAFALTTVQFDPKSGQIYDADSEINGALFDITNSEPEDGADLPSIVTHEAGHFLGLDHSGDPTATMYPSYQEKGPSLRELAPDDMAGICSVYPADRSPSSDSCEPRHGFQSECHHPLDDGCGCRSVGRRPGGSGTASLALGLLTLGLLRMRARRLRGH